MIFKCCDKKMRLYNVDYISKGNYDNYWVCDNCKAIVIEMVRHEKSIKVEFIEDDKMEEK